MSQIADGDIVEVVLRGIARDVNRYGLTIGSILDGNRIITSAQHVVSVGQVVSS